MQQLLFNFLKSFPVTKSASTPRSKIKNGRSNKNGIFKANLSVGKYSIFILEKDGYFANTFDGDNYISPVTIHANKFTEIQILVNYQAYY